MVVIVTMLLGVFVFIITVINGQRPTADKITNLPGLDFTTTYDQYSGYLDLSNGHHLHYWLTEAQSDPDNAPVVLWMNGGPGCSSLDGLLYELGPIHIYDNATLWDNSKYAWNNYANTLFLEAPIWFVHNTYSIYHTYHSLCLYLVLVSRIKMHLVHVQ